MSVNCTQQGVASNETAMARSNRGPGRRFAARTRQAGVMALAFGIGSAALATASPRAFAGTTARGHQGWVQLGKASWYGGKFNGRRTAIGERFDMNAFTCAHRTLPLGSWVRVTNVHNKRSVYLRVNDRGPVPETIAIDLTYAAARRLGISGLANVKIERVSKEVVDQARNAHPSHPTISRAPLFEMASNAYGVPVLPPSIADR